MDFGIFNLMRQRGAKVASAYANPDGRVSRPSLQTASRIDGPGPWLPGFARVAARSRMDVVGLAAVPVLPYRA